jgi:HAD superfamily hydrolase (TIGR01490 family)
MKKRLVLFDFDGTITTKDTFIQFLIFYKGSFRFLMGMLATSPILAMYALKLIPNWKAKQAVLRHFIGNENVQSFNNVCEAFSRKALPKLIRAGALEAIRKYQLENCTVAVVSASAENWVAPWCKENGILCIATQLEVVNGTINGNLCGQNCYGPEKVNRIRKHFPLNEFDEIIAYGDSSGDREMFGIAHQQYYKPFRTTEYYS